MMRTMGRTGERIGKLDIAIAVALTALGVLLMYGNATDADVDSSWLAIPVFLGVTVPVLWRRAAPLHVKSALPPEDPVVGSPDRLVQRIGEMAEAGAARVHLRIIDLSVLDHVDLIASEVLPLVIR